VNIGSILIDKDGPFNYIVDKMKLIKCCKHRRGGNQVLVHYILSLPLLCENYSYEINDEKIVEAMSLQDAVDVQYYKCVECSGIKRTSYYNSDVVGFNSHTTELTASRIHVGYVDGIRVDGRVVSVIDATTGIAHLAITNNPCNNPPVVTVCGEVIFMVGTERGSNPKMCALCRRVKNQLFLAEMKIIAENTEDEAFDEGRYPTY